MEKYPNIVWILVDSVRSYHSEGDDRSKLPMMDRFGEHSVEFLNVVTSAPSTIMSISAMMTSSPSYMIARNYDDFTIDNRFFTAYSKILEENGYFTMAFFRHPHPREKLDGVLNPAFFKYWESGLRHGDTWSNTDLQKVIRNALQDNLPQPAFLFAHFTCRRDPHISEIVENTLEDFIAAGFTYNNTIYVLCSDHGYPDPKRGYTPEGIQRMGMTHDMLLTDDNIKIPLYISYPGCKSKKITKTVSSLDIVPTLLDIGDLSEQIDKDWQGVSLRPLMDDTSKDEWHHRLFVRSDARLMYQSGRTTAIRNDRYKYLHYHDRNEDEQEEFFDIVNDPWEGENIIDSRNNDIQQIITEFRTEFNRQENEAFQRQVAFTLSKFEEQTKRKLSRNRNELNKVLMIIEPQSVNYGDIALRVVQKTWSGASVDLLMPGDMNISSQGYNKIYTYLVLGASQDFQFDGPIPRDSYDLDLVFTINPASGTAKKLLHLSRQVVSKKTLVLDCNMNAYQRKNYWYYRFRAVMEKMKYMRKDPKALWNLVCDIYSILAKRLFKRSK